LYVCVYARMPHLFVYGFVCNHIRVYLWMTACVYGCTSVCVCVYIYVCQDGGLYVCVYVCMYVCMCGRRMRACMCVCNMVVYLWCCVLYYGCVCSYACVCACMYVIWLTDCVNTRLFARCLCCFMVGAFLCMCMHIVCVDATVCMTQRGYVSMYVCMYAWLTVCCLCDGLLPQSLYDCALLYAELLQYMFVYV